MEGFVASSMMHEQGGKPPPPPPPPPTPTRAPAADPVPKAGRENSGQLVDVLLMPCVLLTTLSLFFQGPGWPQHPWFSVTRVTTWILMVIMAVTNLGLHQGDWGARTLQRSWLWRLLTNHEPHDDTIQRSLFPVFSRQTAQRLAVSLSLFVLAVLVSVLSVIVAGYRSPSIRRLDSPGLSGQDAHRLPDLGHLLLAGQGGEGEEGTDHNLAMHLAGQTALWMSLMHPRRLQILRRALLIIGFIHLNRALTIQLTSMPDPYPGCLSGYGAELRRPWDWGVAAQRMQSILANFSETPTCGDMIFSGHTVIILVAMWTVRTYYGRRRRYETAFTQRLPRWVIPAGVSLHTLCCVAGIVQLVAVQLHYTVDIMVAFYVTWGTWFGYHQALDRLRRGGCKGEDSYFEPSLWLVRAFRWMEAEEVAFGELDRSAKAGARGAGGEFPPFSAGMPTRKRRRTRKCT